MKVQLFIRVLLFFLLLSYFIVYFTVGFGWVCQSLIVIMFILTFSYPLFKKRGDKKDEK